MATLPIYYTSDRNLSLLQTNWSSSLNPILNNPLVSGQLLTGISLGSGTTIVNHRLGRKLQGWITVGIDGAAQIYDNQASNQSPQLTLSLTSDAAVIVSLWVF